MLLADSCLEQARARVATAIRPAPRDDGRVPPEAWRAAFGALAEVSRKWSPRTPPRSRATFNMSTPGRAASRTDPERRGPLAFAQFAPFEVEVQVHFDVNGAPLDADGTAARSPTCAR